MPSWPENSGSSANGPPHFRLRGVSRRYGTATVLDRIDLEIREGEAVALVGPSGAGKTTLLRLLNGMLLPTTGSVEFHGRDLAGLSRKDLRAVRARIGFVHQDLSLVPNVRVSQNVAAGKFGSQSFLGACRTWLLPTGEDLRQTHEILERVGIGEKLFQRTDTLSGGQLQRVAIARALFQRPDAILADEPVSSVDPARARDTVALLSEISRERGLTLIVSLHNLELAHRFFPRLIGLRSGRVEFDHSSDNVTDECFRKLYDLRRDEMMDDGA